MTTEQQFNCIFCKEIFSNKEELQIHFRKHGDPNFDKSTKSKNRALFDSPNTPEKLIEDNEMVGCDVCDEVFPTISKAITHKHKIHPDHDAKYFCPFCGKLFTMKHLYNKHIQSNHDSQLSVEKSDFHCDCCEVMFYVPSAMLYHNKFFHRQDQDLTGIGVSKKVKLCSQEMIQLYYCTFCGEEYNNKVNLQKHMADDHADENQNPTDVLKCPLCEAVFYHLDAYELHLMFHTTEDVYSERNELADEVTEFSLETVPPIAEKLEEETAQDSNTGDAVDMENFLQLLMGESEDNGIEKIKTKKHKKHKKSKKAAITLDEFLNMNKDVFGDGLDVQGIEEIPTQAVLKNIKGKKPITNKTKAINADINKLKKIGITVKTKSGNHFNPIVNRCIVNKTASHSSNNEGKKTNVGSAPEDLLSKLMRQGNSQIKIVKKSANQNIPEFETAVHQNTPTSDTEEKEEENANIIDKSSKEDNMTSENDILQNNGDDNDHKDRDDDNNEECGPNVEEEPNRVATNLNNVPHNQPMEMEDDTNIKNNIDDIENSFQMLNPNSTELSTELISQSKNSLKTSESNNLSPHEENKNRNTPDLDTSDELSNKISTEDDDSSNKAIGALKHLSHLITIKPIKQNKKIENISEDDEIHNTSEHDSSNSGSDADTEVAVAKTTIPSSSILCNKTSEALKNLSKNVTIKSISNNLAKSDSIKEQSDDNDDSKYLEVNNSFQKTLSNEPSNQSRSAVKDTQRTTPEVRLNSAAKQTGPNNQKEMPALSKPSIKVEKPLDNKLIDSDIEIFNIDDSDSEDDTRTIQEELKKNTSSDKVRESAQIPNVIHNLGSNITIKSNYQKPIEVKNKSNNNDAPVNKFKKVNKPSPEIQKSINLQNTLKSLGSHITIKSTNSSSTCNEEITTYDNDEAHSDHGETDSETEEGKVKITEITEETSDLDNEEHDDYDTNAIVHSPSSHESDSDHKSGDESDIESQIKASTLNKPDGQIPGTMANVSENIKNLSKDLVIKPLNDKKNHSENIPNTSYEKKTSLPTHISNFKPASQTGGPSNQMNTVNRKMNTSANEVNTVKTVKKFQTETVIQEITTVTRTIRTVNESSNEIVQTGNQSSVTIPQKIHRIQPGKEHQGKVIRHINPTIGTKVRTPGFVRPAGQTPLRAPNQLVPIRTLNTPILHSTSTPRKQLGPGSQIIRKAAPPMGSPQTVLLNKLRMSPNVVTQTSNKRPSEGNTNIHSSIKKHKESTVLIPKNNNASMEQYTASTSRSEFSSVTKVVNKGGKSMSATQTRSEVNTTQQQLSKLSNMSGLKIMKKSTKQAMEVEEKSDVCASKRNTMEAIEKLQKQGLLVKKPRVEFNDASEQDYFSESDEDNFEQ